MVQYFLVQNQTTLTFHTVDRTENKKNKQNFFRQMGQWYLDDKCIDTTVENILGLDKNIAQKNDALNAGYLVGKCCASEPFVSCFFRDKPSMIPCKDSPNIDEGKKSFW